jgi:beta-glucosidase/6-phospho-beta-glucosidase/beta-galactosidase
MGGFGSSKSAQRFVSFRAAVYNTFNDDVDGLSSTAS